jgi:hypothetical protein
VTHVVDYLTWTSGKIVNQASTNIQTISDGVGKAGENIGKGAASAIDGAFNTNTLVLPVIGIGLALALIIAFKV